MYHHLYAMMSVILSILAGTLSVAAQGFELSLPTVGTDINYNFHGEMPDFQITASAATADVLAGRLTFADGKAIRPRDDSGEYSFSVYLTLRSPGILDLFDEIFLGFDESFALLDKAGSILGSSPANFSIGYNPDVRDAYEYGWDFRDPSLPSIYGMEWNIVPNLQAGKTLPDALGLEMKVFIAGSVYVVPEPTAVVLAISVVFFVGIRRKVLPFGV